MRKKESRELEKNSAWEKMEAKQNKRDRPEGQEQEDKYITGNYRK